MYRQIDFKRRKDFSGFLRVISSKEGRTAFRVPGVIGLRFLSGMVYNPFAYNPSTRLIRSPGFKVTTAFLMSGIFLTRGP